MSDTLRPTTNSGTSYPRSEPSAMRVPLDDVMRASDPRHSESLSTRSAPLTSTNSDDINSTGRLSDAGGSTPNEFAELIRLIKTPITTPVPDSYVIVKASYDGVVQQVHGDYFVGEFVPAGRAEPRLRADFPVEQVIEDERELITPGALFELWTGSTRMSRRRWVATSEVRFRRLPPVRDGDLQEALMKARDRATRLRDLNHRPE